VSRELCRRIVANVRAMFDDLPDDGQGPLVVLGQGEYAREVGGKAKPLASEVDTQREEDAAR